MKKILISALVVCAGIIVSGCKGSGNGGGLSPPTVGIAVPQQVTAIPPKTTGASLSASTTQSLTSTSAEALTDLQGATTNKYVDEKTLTQTDILNKLFGALSQTHYADPENIGIGPYTSMVTSLDDHGNGQQKTLELWVTSSSLITDSDGQPANLVQAWIPQTMGDPSSGHAMTVVIRAVIKVKRAPTRNPDGSYADAGIWSINAKFTDDGSLFFAAQASIDASGRSVIRMHQVMQENGPTPVEQKAWLVQAPTTGFGKILFTDYSNCSQQSCQGLLTVGEYAYNSDTLEERIGTGTAMFKSRNNAVDVVDRYGLFVSSTGINVTSVKKFGFGFKYTDQGTDKFGWYGAWQGRHSLWTNGGQPLPAGVTVTRFDQNGSNAATYTSSPLYTGIFVKRSLVDSSITAIAGMITQTNQNVQWFLTYDGSQFNKCVSPDFSHGFPPHCASSGPLTPDDYSNLVGSDQQWVGINGNAIGPNQPQNYVYDPMGSSGAGFYVATMGSNGHFVSTGTKLVPNTQTQLYVNIGGQIYLSFNANGTVVQKKVISIDHNTNQPTFDDSADRPFTLEPNRQYYLNNQGANSVVTADANGGILKVQTELQTAANPVNAASFVPANTIFVTPWDTSGSTFSFNTSPGAHFMKLVYLTVGRNDASNNVHIGDVVTNGQWGLAIQGGQSTDPTYNWEYPSAQNGCSNCGTTQYLLDGSANFVILDNPIRCRPINLTDATGATVAVSLQFDGNWMQGLRDVFQDLQQANWTMTDAIARKVLSVPNNTTLTDADDPTVTYTVVQLSVREYLRITADPGSLSLSDADTLDLSNMGSVTAFIDSTPPIGSMPVPPPPVKYSDGRQI